MSFKTALAADFKREYKNIELLWKQRPGIGAVLVTRATEKRHVDPENLVLSLTRLRDFLVEREVKEFSLPVYDPEDECIHGSCMH